MFTQQDIQVQARVIRGNTDMKILKKTNSLLGNNSGESIAEVLIAFILLTIVMVMFAQGLAAATNSQANARASRESADKSMKALQTKLVSTKPTDPGDGFGVSDGVELSNGTYSYSVKSYKYVDSNGNTYVVFMPNS